MSVISIFIRHSVYHMEAVGLALAPLVSSLTLLRSYQVILWWQQEATKQLLQSVELPGEVQAFSPSVGRM